MKQLTCEMCGSTELMKQDGVFICQTCGTKYSVEEAKKMMVEGTVDVSGSTVKVDNSDFIEKCLQNARRAKQKEDWAETEKYYNMVEQNDPTNIEAIFYSSYGKAKASLVENDIYKREAIFKVLTNCVSILDDNYKVEKGDVLLPMLQQISTDIIKLYNSNFVYTQTKNGYGVVTSTNKSATLQLFINLCAAFMDSIENIVALYSTQHGEEKVRLYKLAIENGKSVIPVLGNSTEITFRNALNGSLISDVPVRSRISKFETNLRNIELSVKNESKRKYWEEHAEEKEKLENDLAEATKKAAALRNELNLVERNFGKVDLQNKITALNAEKDALGLFKFKERKEIQQKLGSAYAELNTITQKVDTEKEKIQKELDSFESKKRTFKNRLENPKNL